MSTISIDALGAFIQKKLEKPGVQAQIETFIKNGSSAGGQSREGVFRVEFLCPTLVEYFSKSVKNKLGLSTEQIRAGLGTEGYRSCEGFGFTPANKKKHLFRKEQIVESRPPKSWFKDGSERLSGFQACPDFAISAPLPLSIVGEIKYFNVGSPDRAVTVLYDAARQAMFYLGAFGGRYRSAMLVIGDASPNHAFHKGLELLRPELVARFGHETDIHLVSIRLQ